MIIQGRGAADFGEYRQAAGAIEPPSDVGSAMIQPSKKKAARRSGLKLLSSDTSSDGSGSEDSSRSSDDGSDDGSRSTGSRECSRSQTVRIRDGGTPPARPMRHALKAPKWLIREQGVSYCPPSLAYADGLRPDV